MKTDAALLPLLRHWGTADDLAGLTDRCDLAGGTEIDHSACGGPRESVVFGTRDATHNLAGIVDVNDFAVAADKRQHDLPLAAVHEKAWSSPLAVWLTPTTCPAPLSPSA